MLVATSRKRLVEHSDYKRTRVLHVNAGNLHGGIETLLVTLADQQAICPDLEWNFALCFEGRLADELRAAGANVEILGPARISRPWTVSRVRRRLLDLLRGGDYDVAVTHGCWPHAIAAPAIRRAKTPLVFWAHALHAGRNWTEWWATRTPPDMVLANSRATQGAVATHLFPTTPSEVVHLPSARPTALNVTGVRESLATAPDDIVVLTACRLEPLKGHDILAEALGKLRDIPGWRWWIAGGPQRPEETRLLEALRMRVVALGIADRVRFLGQRSDVPRLMAAADILCQANIGPESFGLTFVEALHAGLPVVTSALGGALEIINDTCGVLVPPGSADKLANVLTQLMRDDGWRASLSEAAPARASKLCDPAARIRDLQVLFAKVGHG